MGREACIELERQYHAELDTLTRSILQAWFGSESATQFVVPYERLPTQTWGGEPRNDAETGRIIAANFCYPDREKRLKKGRFTGLPNQEYFEKDYEEVDVTRVISGGMFIQFGVGYVTLGQRSDRAYILRGGGYNRDKIQTFFIDEPGAQGQFIQAISLQVDQDREKVDSYRRTTQLENNFEIQPATQYRDF